MSVEQNHWSERRERGDVVGLRIMYAAYVVLGRWAFTLLLYPVVAYFFATARGARRASRQYLQRVARRLSDRGAPRPPRLGTFNHLLAFGNAILDKGAMWAGAFPASNIEFADPQAFRRARESGRGALFIGSHLGNIEMLRAHADIEQGVKINTLVFTRNSPNLNRLLAAVAPRALDRMIQIDTLGPESVVKLQDRIRAGEHIAIAADRLSALHSDRAQRVPFLGGDAPFPEGPFILASLLGCPVYLVFCLQMGGRYRVFIEPFDDPVLLPRNQRRDALRRTMTRYAQRLEEYCLLAPTQWFNFFDFWGQPDRDRAAE